MASTRDQTLSVAAKVGLGAEELGKPCDDRLFHLLASFVHPWRLTFSSLFSQIDLDDIDQENRSRSEQEKRVAALRKWKARKGREATYGVLLGAILDSGNVDQAELLCEQIADQSQNVQGKESAIQLGPPSSPTHDVFSHQSLPSPMFQATAITYSDLRMDVPTNQPPPRMNFDCVSYSSISHMQMMSTLPSFPIERESQPPPIPPRTYKENKPAFQTFGPAATNHFALTDSDNKGVGSIDDQISRLDEKCVGIENIVLETIRQRDIPVKTMLQWVLVLPMMLKAQFSESLQVQRKEMSGASNIDELFLILSQYWNSLQPSLLEHLVTKLRDAELRIRMKDYIRDLDNFRKRTILGDFVDKWMGIVPPGLEEFIVELGEEWKGKTLHDLEQFRVQLSRQKCFSGHMPFTKKVISGSIMVVFAVSQNVKFKGKELCFFLQHQRILRVMMKGHCVLDLVNTDIEELEDSSSDSSSHYSSSNESDGPESLSESNDECSFPYTMAQQLKWHPVADCLVLSSDRLVVQSNNNSRGEVHVSEPLHRTGEFEFKIEKRKRHNIIFRDGNFGIGLQRRQCKLPPPLYTTSGRCVWQNGAIYNALKNSSSTVGYYSARDLDLLVPGDRVGVMITIEGDLEFFVNGKSQGIAAERVYKVDCHSNLYPLIKLPAGYIVRITAGATQSDVISLQDLCIEYVARLVKSTEDVQTLNLPHVIKDNILKILLNPKEDYIC